MLAAVILKIGGSIIITERDLEAPEGKGMTMTFDEANGTIEFEIHELDEDNDD